MIFNLTKRSGGNPYEKFLEYQVDDIVNLRDEGISKLYTRAFTSRNALLAVYLPNLTTLNPQNGDRQFTECSYLVTVVLPSVDRLATAMFDKCVRLATADFGSTMSKIETAALRQTALNTLVLRRSSVVTLANISAFDNTPFKSGGTGGTIYIPKSLYDHLGDNTADDYKAATNWSTIDGYGTITWKSIESTHTDPTAPIDLTLYHADGTPIPTA